MIRTSCHCGAVQLEFDKLPKTMTQCNCSVCRRYGAIWASYRRKAVRVVADKRKIAFYSWRRKVRQYYHCKTCGCITHYEMTKKKPDGTDAFVVNMRNIVEPELVADIPIKLLDGAGSWKVLSEAPQPALFLSPRAVAGDQA